MSWFRRFLANPRNLAGPNWARAPLHRIELSGTVLSFLCPQPTTKHPLSSLPQSIDIERAPVLDESDAHNAQVLIFTRSWTFFNRAFLGTAYGDLNLEIYLLRNTDTRDARRSLMLTAVFEQWILQSNAQFYGQWNKNTRRTPSREDAASVDEDIWQYPKTRRDLQRRRINTQQWVRYERFEPRQPPEIIFETPITHQHIISAIWTPRIFHGRDYFSHTHNLHASTLAFSQTLMDSMQLDLSTEATRQRAALGRA